MIRPINKLDNYRYVFSDISLTSSNLKEPIDIHLVRNLGIIHDYDNAISPFMMITVAVSPSSYNSIIENMDTLKFKMNIGKILISSNSTNKDNIHQVKKYISIDGKVTIKDPINTYDMGTIAINKNETDKKSIRIDSQFSTFTFYVYDNEAINKYRTCHSYIIQGGMNDVLYRILADRSFKNILMSNCSNNTYDEYIIPYGNLGKNLEDLNKYYGIYENNYLFYMDTNTTYLINKSAVGSILNSKEYGSVNIYLESLSNPAELSTGSYSDNVNRLYILNGMNFVVHDNDSTIEYYNAGKITSIINGEKTSQTDVFGKFDVERAFVFDNKYQRTQIISKIKEDKKYIGIELENIDLNIITPNKEYNVILDESYSQRYDISGKYRLCKSNIIFENIGDNDTDVTIQIGLKKIN